MEKESKYGIFIYNEDSASFIDELSDYFDGNAKEIIAFFNVKEGSKPIINIISTKEEFDKEFKIEYGYDAPLYARGISKRDGSINYLSINDYKNTTHAFESKDYNKAFLGFKKTLVHEYVHVVNRWFNKENHCYFSSVYLFEGIATYLSKQKDDLVINFDYQIEDFLITNGGKRKYDAFYLITKYLMENYDKEFIMELLKDKDKADEFLVKKLYYEAKEFYNKKKQLN